jgi:chemotaxis protein MotB
MSATPRSHRRLPPLALCLSLGLVAAATASCGPSQEDLDAERARVRELESALETANGQRAEVDARLAALGEQNTELAQRLRALGQNVEELEGERSTLAANLAETRRALEELRERERQAQARVATFRSLIERFRSMIESGRLRVRIVRNRMVVELPTGILFDSASSELKEEGLATLNEVTSVLREIDNREFQIAGHTDNLAIRTRQFPDNWALSTARAVTVARHMITQGVPANRISAAGHADTQPMASNDDEAGRALNRRIEIVLLPNLDELPDLTSLE